jgi:hypothetical protein
MLVIYMHLLSRKAEVPFANILLVFVHSNYFLAEIRLKTIAVVFPPPIFVEYRPSLQKFDPWLVFSAPIWVKFAATSANLVF